MFSQTEPQFTQYMFNNSSFNPAAAGESELIHISGAHRMQWVGMPNAGSTTIFQINTPVNLLGQKNGIGIKFKNDAVGQFFYQGAYLQYAYKRKLGEGTLSAGIDLGFINAGFRGDSISLPSVGDYHETTGDPLLQMGSEASGIAFDMGMGVWYSSKLFYMGLSYLSLTNPTVSWTDTHDYSMLGTIYATGGYNFQMRNPKLVITPSFLLKTDLVAAQLDISGLARYDEKFWGGLAYRWKESIGILAGLNIFGGLAVGYSFDLPITQIRGWGSHELSVSYEFEYLFGKNKNKHKSVRIL